MQREQLLGRDAPHAPHRLIVVEPVLVVVEEGDDDALYGVDHVYVSACQPSKTPTIQTTSRPPAPTPHSTVPATATRTSPSKDARRSAWVPMRAGQSVPVPSSAMTKEEQASSPASAAGALAFFFRGIDGVRDGDGGPVLRDGDGRPVLRAAAAVAAVARVGESAAAAAPPLSLRGSAARPACCCCCREWGRSNMAHSGIPSKDGRRGGRGEPSAPALEEGEGGRDAGSGGGGRTVIFTFLACCRGSPPPPAPPPPPTPFNVGLFFRFGEGGGPTIRLWYGLDDSGARASPAEAGAFGFGFLVDGRGGEGRAPCACTADAAEPGCRVPPRCSCSRSVSSCAACSCAARTRGKEGALGAVEGGVGGVGEGGGGGDVVARGTAGGICGSCTSATPDCSCCWCCWCCWMGGDWSCCCSCGGGGRSATGCCEAIAVTLLPGLGGSAIGLGCTSICP
jgi:hypothetical protein